MMRKKILAVLLAAVFVFPAVSEAKIATAAEVTQNSNEEMQKTITAILTKVKEKISIPEELSEFTYDYNQETKDSVRWTFRWNDPDYTKAVRIVCDQSGNLLSYSNRNYESSEKKEIKYLRSELYEKALAYIKQLNPGMEEHVRLANASYGSDNTYTYTFYRTENELLMRDNTVSVTVSAVDGSLTYMYADWSFDVTIPDSTPKITKEKAAEIIGQNITMKLSYYATREIDASGKTTTKAFLVYEPDQSYIAVDALTGEVYTTKSEWNIREGNAAAKNDMKESTSDSGMGMTGNLTTQEIAKIEELKDLISQEKAISLIKNNQSLLLEDTANSITANLYQRYSKEEESEAEYYWRIAFTDPREPDYENNDFYRAYAYADIDAKTGEILSYQSSVKGLYTDAESNSTDITFKYSDAKLRTVFENFVKEQNAAKFALCKLNSEENDYLYAKDDLKEVYGGKSYTYTRYHENIPFNSDYFYGSADKVTGKIYSYGSCWTEDVVFESSQGAMTSAQALQAFLNNDAFDLSYELNTIYNYDMSVDQRIAYDSGDSTLGISYTARLVYSIENIYPMRISPFTGKQINWDGSEYEVKEVNLLSPFTDIEKSPYKRSIQILNDIGLDLNSEKFYPERYITGEELIAFAQAADLYCDETTQNYIRTGKVTKQKAANYFIQLLGLTKVAALDGIYKTDYKDEASIQSANLGSVALMKGFGILTADSDGNYNPNQRLTRAQAADMILKLRDIQTVSEYYY